MDTDSEIAKKDMGIRKGQRVSKTAGGVSSAFLWDGGHYLEK